jgi:hypothetical protein
VDQNELSPGEIRELAAAFSVGQHARTLLRLARFPAELVPAMEGRTALDFWSEVAEEISCGVLIDGRRRLLDAAHSIYQDNPIFVAASSPPPPVRVPVRVLVIGASPSDMLPIRADREARTIAGTAPGLLKVEIMLGAEATDLEKVRAFRPDILHFACHGQGDHLIFNTVLGESDPVLASRIAQTLGYYRENSGVKLRAIVLGSCDGEKLAPDFTGVADTVVAHRRALSDPCGVAFAAQFYRLVSTVPASAVDRGIAAAAREAAQLTAQFSESCATVIDNLIVLGADG